MPLLAAFIANLLGGFVGWLGQYFTKRTANYVGLVALTGAAAGAMWAGVTALVAGFSAVMPAFMAAPLTWLLPPNTDECFGAYMTAQVICAGYRWHRDTVRASAGA